MKMYVPPLIRIPAQLIYSCLNNIFVIISLDILRWVEQTFPTFHCNSHREMSMRKNRSSSLLRATTAILTLIAFALSLLGSSSWHELSLAASPQSPQLATTSTQGDTTHTLYCGLWRTDGGFVSTIRIKNSLVVAPLEVNPILYMADGTAYPLRPVSLAIAGVASLDVNDALAVAPASIAGHLSQYGSVALFYRYPTTGHVIASVVTLDVSRSLSFVYPFTERMPMPGHMSGQVLEGLWWKRDQGVSRFVSVSNATDGNKIVSLQLVSGHGKSQAAMDIQLSAHSTRMLQLDDVMTDFSDPDNRTGGIRVEYKGWQGAIIVAGGLVNEHEGYSANIPFWSHDMSSSSPFKIIYETRTGVNFFFY